MQKVILEPVDAKIYARNNLEPQYTTYRDPNRAIVYLDSEDNTLETNKVDILMSTIRILRDNASMLTSGINRISVQSAGIFYNIPNVNPRNNVLTFFSSNSGLFHTVTVPEGFYTTSNALITAVVIALNTATGASGLTFSFTVIAGFPDNYNLNSVGGNYYFTLTCLGIKYGVPLWNLPIDQIATNTKIVGTMGLWYTRYIDITSETLTKYCKVRTVSTNNNENIVLRIFVNDPTSVHLIPWENAPVSASYNYLPNEPIYTIHFSLYDQFGNLLYIPNGAQGTVGGFEWNVQLLVSI